MLSPKIILAFAIALIVAIAVACVRMWPEAAADVVQRSLMRLRQNPVLWAYTFTAIVLAVALTITGGVLLYHAPPNLSEFSDVGPAVGDLGVLAAALFAVAAALVPIIANRQDARDADASRKAAIQQICKLEILAFWDRANELKLAEGLVNKIDRLKNLPADADNENKKLFRRYLGDDWFRLSLVDPRAVGELGLEAGGSFLALSAGARNVISRFNWLNGASYPQHDVGFWIEYMTETHQQLMTLDALSRTMLINLGDRQTLPSTFRFKTMGQVAGP